MSCGPYIIQHKNIQYQNIPGSSDFVCVLGIKVPLFMKEQPKTKKAGLSLRYLQKDPGKHFISS